MNLSFHEDLPIVLSGNTLSSYSNAMKRTGTLVLDGVPPDALAAYDGQLFLFYGGQDVPHGAVVETLDVAALSPGATGRPVNPVGLAYTPDRAILGNDQILYLLSVAHLSVFRWSVDESAYLDTLPLSQGPSYMAYSAENNTLYLARNTREILSIQDVPPFSEDVFAISPGMPTGLACAGEYVFLTDSSYASEMQYTFRPDGVLVSAEDTSAAPGAYVWSAASRRMYYYRKGSAPEVVIAQEIDGDGRFGIREDSRFYAGSSGVSGPIAADPKGEALLVAPDRIHDPVSLELIHELPNSVVDATWWNGDLFTLRDIANVIQLQRWRGDTFEPVQTVQWIVDEQVGVFPLDSGVLVVLLEGGIPTFRVVIPE